MSTVVRRSHQFTVIVSGVSQITDALEDAILAAGCDDALLWEQGGVVGLGFDRDAESLGKAIESAADDLVKAGITFVRIDIDS